MEILWGFIEIIATIFEHCVLLCGLRQVFGSRYQKKIDFIYLISFIIILTVNITFINTLLSFEGYFTLIQVGIIIVYAFLALQGNLIKKIFCAVGAMALLAIINIQIIYFLSCIFGLPENFFFLDSDIARLMGLFLSKTVFFVIISFIIVFLKKKTLKLSVKEYGIAIFLFSVTLFILIALIYIQLKSEYANQLMFAVSVGILTTNIIICIGLNYLSRANETKMKLSLFELQLSKQKSIMEQANIMVKEARTIGHDLKHHIRIILKELDDGNTNQAKDYLQSVLQEYEVSSYRDTIVSNSMVNSVLNLKIAQCQKEQIDIKLEIESDFSYIRDVDICVLLSNLLENAIEACALEEERRIILSIREHKSYLCILVKNKISSSVIKHNENLKTTKNDGAHHGLGIYSVSQICDKYDGFKTYYEKGGYFVADIWLKQI